MQNWKEFLKENYNLTEAEYEALSTYEKAVIRNEFESMWKGYR